jgi:hypothetical protein
MQRDEELGDAAKQLMASCSAGATAPSLPAMSASRASLLLFELCTNEYVRHGSCNELALATAIKCDA